MRWDRNDLHIVIDHPNRGSFDDDLFRRIVFESEAINYLPMNCTILDVLVYAEVFKSKNEARKNWKRGDLKEGMNRFERVGKLNKNIYILKLPNDFPLESKE